VPVPRGLRGPLNPDTAVTEWHRSRSIVWVPRAPTPQLRAPTPQLCVPTPQLGRPHPQAGPLGLQAGPSPKHLPTKARFHLQALIEAFYAPAQFATVTQPLVARVCMPCCMAPAWGPAWAYPWGTPTMSPESVVVRHGVAPGHAAGLQGSTVRLFPGM